MSTRNSKSPENHMLSTWERMVTSYSEGLSFVPVSEVLRLRGALALGTAVVLGAACIAAAIRSHGERSP